ncbi:MAG: vWA domain-containing protein [Bacteroidales bacterium]|jgi:Ca-activated chloride channel family protein|nr:vWA domain-containing protein [Bacteroidales bacterium]
MKSFPKILLLFFIIFSVFESNAQTRNQRPAIKLENQKTRILFIVDCSYSMYGKWQSDSKIKITQSILSNVIDSLNGKANVDLALRAFGHTQNYTLQDCNDTKLEIPFSSNNNDIIKDKLKGLVPKGSSPIAKSFMAAKTDFPECRNCRNIVILITDGIDDCGDDPCSISQTIQNQGIIKPFIIGIGMGNKDYFKCVGIYFEVNNEIEFTKKINDIVNQAIYGSTCQVDLFDSYKSLSVTNVPMIFYETKSKQPKYSFIHTMNSKGLSDTLEIDPLINYDIEIQTLPKVKVENVNIKAGSHTIIPIQASQGTLVLKYKGKAQSSKPIEVLIKKKGERETINSQDINSSERYLVGKYDLEVLTQPRLFLENIEIVQNSTTQIEIPSTGNLQISKPSDSYSTLFVNEEDNWKFVTNLSPKQLQTIPLLPGKYQVVFRPRQSSLTKDTKVIEFKIESSETTIISFETKNK